MTAARVARLAPVPPLHVVTDDEVVARREFVGLARGVIAAGGAGIAFHLRAHAASGRRMFDLAAALRESTSAAGAWLIVNDRSDVALAAGADGVQVGARGLLPRDARRVIGPERALGVSVHSVEEARDALAGEPDFLVGGTIWRTASHPGRPGAGVALLREIAARGIPVIAIGGVTPGRVAEARGAGAAGVAVLRGVWDAPDPAAAVREYLDEWRECG